MKNGNAMYILRLAGTLFLITALVAAALAGVNAITAPRIAESKAAKTQQAIELVLPGGGEEMAPGTFDNQGGLVSRVYKSETGYAVEVVPSGFDGTITMMVVVTTDGAVTEISIISHTETAGLGAVAAAKTEAGAAFRGQYSGKTGTLEVGTDIDAITGATITSKAVTSGVNAALACVAALG